MVFAETMTTFQTPIKVCNFISKRNKFILTYCTYLRVDHSMGIIHDDQPLDIQN